MIREYRTGISIEWVANDPADPVPHRSLGPPVEFTNGAWAAMWDDRMSVDLRSVTSAQPYDAARYEAVALTVMGGHKPFVINEDYERFVRDWRTAKP